MHHCQWQLRRSLQVQRSLPVQLYLQLQLFLQVLLSLQQQVHNHCQPHNLQPGQQTAPAVLGGLPKQVPSCRIWLQQ